MLPASEAGPPTPGRRPPARKQPHRAAAVADDLGSGPCRRYRTHVVVMRASLTRGEGPDPHRLVGADRQQQPHRLCDATDNSIGIEGKTGAGRIAGEEGFGALYKGLIPNIGRGMMMNVGMMACSDQAKEMMLKITGDDPEKPTMTTRIGAAAAGGFFAAWLSLPFDLGCSGRDFAVEARSR